MSTIHNVTIDDVLDFWFGSDPQKWFMKDPEFDAAIRERFGQLHAEATAGAHLEWIADNRGALALIIVLDQFSRNLFRDDARAFANDARALAITRELISTRRLYELEPTHQMFALIPLEHAEDMAPQRECIEQFTRLANETGNNSLFVMAVDYAKRHAAIIERFGRFPHRNAALGRESTPEELTFLTQPGSSF